ncbi:MAG: tetratricopeptide repeat protein [Vicinamibacterales bacterium]
MADARIGRLIAAVLHDAVDEELPARLEFYESWLVPADLGRKALPPSSMLAVLSFLRQEGDGYTRVMEAAGRRAAEWTLARHSRWRRTWWRLWPARRRAARVVPLLRDVAREVSDRNKVTGRIARGRGRVDVSDSLFCGGRQPASHPLCTFYRAAAAQLLELLGVAATVEITACKATGHASCQLSVQAEGARPRASGPSSLSLAADTDAGAETDAGPPGDSPERPPVSLRTGARPALARGRVVAAVALVALLVSTARAHAGDGDRVLVMPFEVTHADVRTSWVGEAAALLLTEAVGASGALVLSREDRVRAFEYFNILPTVAVSRAMTIRMGESMGASAIIVGTVESDGAKIAVHARRLDVEASQYVAHADAEAAIETLAPAMARVGDGLGFRTAPVDAEGLARLPVSALEPYVRGLLAQNPSRQLTLLQSALALAPQSPQVRLALWQAHTARSGHEEARQVAASVPASSSWYRRAQFAVGLSQVSAKKFDEAFATFKRLNDAGSNAPLLNNLGVVQLNRPGTAAADGRASYFFSKAAELERGDPDYCFNLGLSYWLEHDVDAAIYWLREAVRRDASDGDAHVVLAAALHASAAPAEAERERDLARLLASNGDNASTATTVRRGMERVSNDLDVPRIRSVNVALGETVGRDQLEMVGFHLDRGQRFFDQRLDGEALTELRKAVYLSPYEALPHKLIGRIYLRSGQTRQAIDTFRVALWCEEATDVRLDLARALMDLHQYDDASTEVQRVLALDPQSAEARKLVDELARARQKH